jgi:hypothetical protein
MERRWNEIDKGKPKYSGKNLSTSFTTNPTWTDPGWNPDLRGERPATNRLGHGTAFCLQLLLPEGETAKPGKRPKSNALSEIGEHWLEKYFHIFRL